MLWLNKTQNRRLLIVLILILGTLLRAVMPLRGFNYDIESWKIAADILSQGGNVYGQTGRYNYGPIWFYVLHFLDQYLIFGAGYFEQFRWKVSLFLSLVDIGIFLLLLRIYGIVVAGLFFLNPISIIITGYHSQLDNFALLIGLFAIVLIEYKRKDWGLIPGLVVLGVSLITKHFLIFFPIWLAFREKSFRNKMLAICIPYSIFIVSFIPFWELGHEGIINNVFLYRSVTNAPFWAMFAPNLIYSLVPKTFLFISAIILLGFIWRKLGALQLFSYYLICVVLLSSAIVNQYFAIVTPAIAIQWNWGYALFTLFTTVFLSVEWSGLHIGLIQKALNWEGVYGYHIAVFLLLIGFIMHLLRSNSLVVFVKKLKSKVDLGE